MNQHRRAPDLPARLLSVEADSAGGTGGSGTALGRAARRLAAKRGWRGRLIPAAAAATVIAVAAVVALLTGVPSSQDRAPASGQLPAGLPSGQNRALTSTRVPAAMPAGQSTAAAPAQLPDGVPPYYLTATISRSLPFMHAEAVVRDSASGRITGTVMVPSPLVVPVLNVAAAPDDRSFIIGVHGTDSAGWPDYRLFRLRISARGRPGPLTELPYLARYQNLGVAGLALSPDGKLLAVSMQVSPFKAANAVLSETIAEIQVINLVTGQVRTWTAPPRGGYYYTAGPPSWADGDQMIAFTWQRSPVGFTNAAMQGVRLLDTGAPGGNLTDSGWTVPGTSDDGTIQGVLITPDGRDLIMATSRNITSGASTGTAVVRIVEVTAASGRLVRVLLTQTARSNVHTTYRLDGSSAVLSLDPAGRYALVQCIQFGWLDIDLHRFTPLPGQAALGAAW